MSKFIVLIIINNIVIVQLDNDVRTQDRFGRYIAHIWLNIDGEYKLLDYMLTRAGLCELEYKDKVDNLYYDYYVEANNAAKKDRIVLYNPNCVDNNWDYINNTAANNRIGIKVVTKDGVTKYAKPLNYELEGFALIDEPFKFRYEEDAILVQKLLFKNERVVYFNTVVNFIKIIHSIICFTRLFELMITNNTIIKLFHHI